MGKFRKKPVVIEAITFDELIEHGKQNTENKEGMPWSFDYKGQSITHENDECYLIPTLEGTMEMTPNDMLITGVKGEIYPCKKDIFEATYEKVEETSFNTQENVPVTLGEKRVQRNFNPSANHQVEEVKQIFADAIDKIESLRNNKNGRECSIAQTEAETACMYAVKSLFVNP